jgi:hypothetical protein
MTQTEEIAEFAAILARELPDKSPSRIAELVLQLTRAAKHLQRVNEHDCNVGLDDRGLANRERYESKILNGARANGLAGARFNHDPRGGSLRVLVPSGYMNTWGQDGVYVPC